MKRVPWDASPVSFTLPDSAGVSAVLPGATVLAGTTVLAGVLEFKAGTRLPEHGESVHDEDEVSFILSGALEAVSGGEAVLVRAGEISFIPAGERHWARVLEDVRIAYVLIPRG